MKKLFIISIFISSYHVYADIRNTLSLREIIEEAKLNNPEILAAKAHWQASKAKRNATYSWPDPQLGIGFEKIPSGNFDIGDASMRMYSISQMIPFPGKTLIKGQMAQKEIQIAEYEYNNKVRDIVAKVKHTYFTLYFIHSSIEINKENKELIQKFAKIAETKYAVGKSSQHDVLQAQVELSLIIDDLITLERDELPTVEAKLNALLNRPPHSPLGIPEEFESPKLEYSKEEIEKIAIEKRPALKVIEYGVEKSRKALTLARMQYLPNFMIKLEQEEMKMPMGTDINRGIMFSITVPLWFWKQGFGISEKSAKKRAMEFSYHKMKNMVLFQVQDALAKFDASERRLNLFKTSIIPQAEQALKVATIAYQTGKVDFLTLMNSERMLRNARLKYYKVLAQHGSNLANLEKMVGAKLSE